MKELLKERFIRYARLNTQSDDSMDITPTTKGQLELGNLLVEELKDIGMQDVSIDEFGYVMATLPSTTASDVPTIGFLAHLDTAIDFTGKDVKPQLIENYDGKDIILNHSDDLILSPTHFPNLNNYIGHTLITTDGTTLLGADNKAGIAEIMTAMDHLIKHPEIEHGPVRVAFTPDEEIGRGPHKFDVEKFGASFAYTVDGGPIGELQYESFNAAAAKLTVQGKNVHPGTAKNKMVHAAKIASAFVQKLPEQEAPEFTENYEGFYHIISMEGDVENALVYLIIRDFDSEQFAHRKATIKRFANELTETYKDASIQIEIADQYYNMRKMIEPVKEIVDIAEQAMKTLNIKPIIESIRGGTDGAQLSFKGLPTPNLFTGGENFHGKYEFASLNDMEKSSEVIIEIIKSFAKQV